MKSAITIGRTNVTIREYRNGRLTEEQKVSNNVVASGRNFIRDLLGRRGRPESYIAIGTGTEPVSDADTALTFEVWRRATSRVNPSGTSVIYELVVLASEANATETVNTFDDFQEIGLFFGTKWQLGELSSGTVRNSSLGGVLVARATIRPIAKDSETMLTISWEIPIESSSGPE